MAGKKNQVVCAFCGRNSGSSKEELYIPSMYEGLAICSDCARKVAMIMDDARQSKQSRKDAALNLAIPNPAASKDELEK